FFVSENCLIQLSSLVHSLELEQICMIGSTRKNNMFGLLNRDWAQIICEMLSNKLDTLQIWNPGYPEYLSSESIDILQTELINFNKKIWFRATCSPDHMEFSRFSNDHSINGAEGDASASSSSSGSSFLISFLPA
ncbi:hypothetical protein PMAYCL1PPCAC_26276, partial [Pristionchus mayeri]